MPNSQLINFYDGHRIHICRSLCFGGILVSQFQDLVSLVCHQNGTILSANKNCVIKLVDIYCLSVVIFSLLHHTANECSCTLFE